MNEELQKQMRELACSEEYLIARRAYSEAFLRLFKKLPENTQGVDCVLFAAVLLDEFVVSNAHLFSLAGTVNREAATAISKCILSALSEGLGRTARQDDILGLLPSEIH